MRSLVFVILFLIAGCGYHTPGSSAQWVGGEGRFVYAELFENITSEPYLENYLADALLSELSRSRALSLTEDKNKADLSLVGTIERFELDSLAHGDNDRIATYRVRMLVKAQLVDDKKDKVLWKKNLRTAEDYSATIDKNDQLENQSFAAKQAAGRIAEEIYSHLFTTF